MSTARSANERFHLIQLGMYPTAEVQLSGCVTVHVSAFHFTSVHLHAYEILFHWWTLRMHTRTLCYGHTFRCKHMQPNRPKRACVPVLTAQSMGSQPSLAHSVQTVRRTACVDLHNCADLRTQSCALYICHDSWHQGLWVSFDNGKATAFWPDR